MNGIIHPCSHKEDYDPYFQITEAEIFENIFKYMEVNLYKMLHVSPFFVFFEVLIYLETCSCNLCVFFNPREAYFVG